MGFEMAKIRIVIDHRWFRMFYLIGISMGTTNPITLKLKIIWGIHGHGFWIFVIGTYNAIFSLMLPLDPYQTVIEVECYPINNMKVQLIWNHSLIKLLYENTLFNSRKTYPKLYQHDKYQIQFDIYNSVIVDDADKQSIYSFEILHFNWFKMRYQMKT